MPYGLCVSVCSPSGVWFKPIDAEGLQQSGCPECRRPWGHLCHHQQEVLRCLGSSAWHLLKPVAQVSFQRDGAEDFRVLRPLGYSPPWDPLPGALLPALTPIGQCWGRGKPRSPRHISTSSTETAYLGSLHTQPPSLGVRGEEKRSQLQRQPFSCSEIIFHILALSVLKQKYLFKYLCDSMGMELSSGLHTDTCYFFTLYPETRPHRALRCSPPASACQSVGIRDMCPHECSPGF